MRFEMRIAAIVLVTGCIPLPGMGRREPAPEPLPPISAPVIVDRAPDTTATRPSDPADPLAGIDTTKRITVRAVDADPASLLMAVATEVGLSVVFTGRPTSRITISLVVVPAAEAIRAIMSAAGLAFQGAELQAPQLAVVFYHLPVNVNQASAETIIARFGVSGELAKFIVESRPSPKIPE